MEAAKPYKLMKHLFKAPYGAGSSYTKTGVAIMELAKEDAGIATFVAV